MVHVRCFQLLQFCSASITQMKQVCIIAGNCGEIECSHEHMILQGVLSIKIAQKSPKMVKSPKFFGACGGQKGARYAREPEMATPPCTITPVGFDL